MAPCSHVQWLRLDQNQSTFTVHSGNRLQHITNSLPRPSKQFPSLLFFVGRRSRSAALRSIFPDSRLPNYRHHGIANICVDPRTADDEYPVLIAAGCPEGAAQVNPSAAEQRCHETTSLSVDWSGANSERESLIDHINARLFSLFIDVLCIFAEDCGGLAGVAIKLSSWAGIGSASSLPSTVRPRVVVVTRIHEDTFEAEVLRFRTQLFSAPKFSGSFSSLNVVNIVGKLRPASGARFSPLKEVLTQETQASRLARTDSLAHFSSAHLASLFSKALTRFSKRPKDGFDFIRASRDGHAVQECHGHIDRFMDLCLEQKLPDSIPLPFIASAILLDSFPPGMHRRCRAVIWLG